MSVLDEGYRSPAGRSRNRPHGNLAFLRVSVVVLFGVLGIRLVFMQILSGSDYARRSRDNHIVEQNILPPRGLISDRNGDPLVANTPVYSASLVPELLPDDSAARFQIYQKLEDLLGVPAVEIQVKVKDAETANRAGLEIKIKEPLTEQQALTLDEATSDMPGVKLNVTPGRQYLGGDAFAHILGYIGPQRAETRAKYAKAGYDLNEPIGIAGLESIYEQDLRGQPGFNASEQDAAGHLISSLKTADPQPGNSLQLAIDKGLQDYVYQLLSDSLDDGTWHAQTAAAVVMSPKTGEVYAIVSVPGFDPAITANPANHQAEWQALANDNVRTPLLNHALTPAAPGSTFKLVTASAALETGNITPSTSVDVPSAQLEIKGVNGKLYYLTDWRAQGPGINIYKGIAYSSNIFFYMASCGLYGYGRPGLGPDDQTSAVILGNWARKYGFGTSTGIDLDGEFDGLIPDPQWKKRTHIGPGFNPGDEQWVYADTCFMGIGQGDVTATPIQVARMTAAVANGGTLLTPHVANAVVAPDGHVVRTIQPQSKDVGVSAEHLAEIREGMHESVDLEIGAGHRAYRSSVDIAGKTGTAEFVDPKTGKTMQHAWFTGFAPFNDPEVVVTVYYDLGVGGDKAAPIASQIFDYFMKNVKH
jgi:penicillin-binding protein 2